MLIYEKQNSSSIKTEDYANALVHLAWYREGNNRFLLFGFVELFPTECPNREIEEELSLPLGVFGRQHYVYTRRFPMDIDKALSWYQLCREKKVVLPEGVWEESGNDVKFLDTIKFAEEPAWPHLVTSYKLPFHALGIVRAHHLIQPNTLPEVEKVFTSPKAVAWLRERLLFDLGKEGEWIGSINLVAPNPVLRSMNQKLGVRPDGVETSDITLLLRQGRSVEGLTLHVAEHRLTGIVSHIEVPVTDPHMRIEHVGKTEQVSTMLKSKEYGLLDYSDPVGFLRSIGVGIDLVSSKKQVKVPDTPGRLGETYVQTVSSDGPGIEIGNSNTAVTATAHIHKAMRDRERAHDAERLGQKWFHGEQTEASEFIRGLISKARKRVYIVDPYFATAELFRFALATSRFDVEVKILTAAEILQKIDRVQPDKEAGEVLLGQLQSIDAKSKIEVFVMTGDPPPIHDRFLVVDDGVWLSGNSLHTIGARAGMMIKLPDPQQVLSELLKFLNQESELAKQRVKPLQAWVEARKKVNTC